MRSGVVTRESARSSRSFVAASAAWGAWCVQCVCVCVCVCVCLWGGGGRRRLLSSVPERAQDAQQCKRGAAPHQQHCRPRRTPPTHARTPSTHLLIHGAQRVVRRLAAARRRQRIHGMRDVGRNRPRLARRLLGQQVDCGVLCARRMEMCVYVCVYVGGWGDQAPTMCDTHEPITPSSRQVRARLFARMCVRHIFSHAHSPAMLVTRVYPRKPAASSSLGRSRRSSGESLGDTCLV
jgi:hypothetical protein